MRRFDNKIVIEVRNDQTLVSSIELAELSNEAEANYAECLATLICAGVQCGIHRDTVKHVAMRTMQCIQTLGVVSDGSKIPLIFKEDISPDYEFAYYDTQRNCNVTGIYNIYADVQMIDAFTDGS